MLKKYLDLQTKFQQLEADLQSPAVVNDSQKLKTISQEYTDLKPLAEKIAELSAVEKSLAETTLLAKADSEMREIAEAELFELEPKKLALEKAIADLSRPQDPLDKKNVIMEIRAGVFTKI